MQQEFYKYQGTGNDFVMIDNRQQKIDKNNTKLVAALCDRRFGIGADGLILIQNHEKADFEMIYFNSDGSQSLCGNGGRCAVAFARNLGIIAKKATFEAIDGLHFATIEDDIVKLQMQDVNAVEKYVSHVFLDTGSPHHVELRENIDDFDIKAEGSKIRYGAPYNEAGSNVNFVKKIGDATFAVRTYERGVEDETLSCGTGVTAVAIAMHTLKETTDNLITLKALGGDLQVSFEENNGVYSNIWLIGPAKLVFKGSI
ncbi:diaminopimelate epimerase [Hyunsoonleella aestuarii]|uniref:Diaminopimelate epimerase n=1 Tax=Hyunsoonleella aestuarii TaxID=912802 RepID=A0ABP8EBG9_9FLAO|nr:diaminopimelate epimerase [Hyunsoonleella aestuarii]